MPETIIYTTKGPMEMQDCISGETEITYNDILRTISQLLCKNNLYIRIPIWFSLILLFIYKRFKRNAVKVNSEQIIRMKEDKVFSHSEAKKDFGYNPLSFYEGIKIEIDEYKKENNLNM